MSIIMNSRERPEKKKSGNKYVRIKIDDDR
jgi:hypothetical protein